MFGSPNFNYAYPWNSYGAQNSAQTMPQQGMMGNIIWVQGEAGARSIQPNPDQTILLMDSEDQLFYIKTADKSGMPQPLRTFKYSEIVPQKTAQVNTENNFVTREEFEKRLAEIENGKSTVPAA